MESAEFQKRCSLADMRTDRFFISACLSNDSFLSQPGGVTLTPLLLPHRWDFPKVATADTDRYQSVGRHVQIQQSTQNMMKTSDSLLRSTFVWVLTVPFLRMTLKKSLG